MKKIFEFNYKKYQWISETESKPVHLSDIVIIDVPDELTESPDIFRYVKNHFLQNQETRIQLDMTGIRELLINEAIKRTKHQSTPLDLTEIGLTLQPEKTGWYWFRPRNNDEIYFRGDDAIQIYVNVENKISKFGFHSKDDFHNCNDLDGYFEEIKSAEKAVA